MQFAPSIKRRLSAAVSFMIIVLVSVISYVTLSQFEHNTKVLIEKQQFTTVSLLANEIDDKLQNALDLLAALAKQFPEKDLQNPLRSDSFLQSHGEIKTIFNNGIFLFNSDGIMVAETQKSGRLGQDFSFREYLASTFKSNKPYIGNPYVSSQSHKHPAVMLTAPIHNPQGKLVGVLAGSIDLIADNVLGRLVNLQHAKTGYYFLISKDRNIILHPNKDRILSQDVTAGANISLEKAIKGFEGSEETITSKGVYSISSYKSLRSRDWIVGANYPVSEAFGAIYKLRNTLVISVFFITVLITMMVWYLLNVLTRPLFDFTRHVESIAEKFGDERKFTVESRDEIGRLANAFNSMVVDLDNQQSELTSQKERLSVTLRSIADGVMVTDNDGCLVLMNRVAEKLTGWSHDEVLGKPINTVFVIVDGKNREPVPDPVQQVLKMGAVASIPPDTILIARNGSEHFIADSCAAIKDTQSNTVGAVLVFQDITEKRRLEEENTRAEKLESIGVLAGGIAHDFNNLLTAILGNISLAKMTIKPEQVKLLERLESAEFASLRAKDLTQRLLTFSQGGAPVRRSLSLGELIRNYAGLALSGSKASCDYLIPEDLWPVEADEGQIGQVISNLIINADQSMPEGGKISIECRNIVLDSSTALPLAPGRYNQVIITDEGHGIPEELVNRVFEPYFTNKDKGRGLGLATAYSIIMNHYGHIALKSQSGIGTTFTFYLPTSDSAVSVNRQDKAVMETGKGRILVMDDEEVVRDVACEMLTHMGYEVDFSADGSEAVQMYKTSLDSKHPYDLVIMDLTIPGGMGGKDAVLKLKEINPAVKAIVSSGYSNDPILADFKNHSFSGAVMKPYKIEELCAAVREVMNI